MSGKRLALYLGCAVMIYLIVIFVVKPLLPPSSQEVHMRQVRDHIAAIEPSWASFKTTNQGFELVKFSVYTGQDGVFRVSGYVTSEVHMAMLLKFITETHPPTPLYTNELRVVAPDEFQIMKELLSEPDGSANQSQPVGPKTNRTSPPAGSGG
jgi:hypothetical protein